MRAACGAGRTGSGATQSFEAWRHYKGDGIIGERAGLARHRRRNIIGEWQMMVGAVMDARPRCK